MKKEKNLVEKAMATMAYRAATRGANAVCYYMFYQPELPEKVKKLRRF